jgi:hydrogenase/urease accessory protein HupE
MSARLAWLVCAFLVLCAPGRAYGHAIGLSRGEYRADSAFLDADVVFAVSELATALPALDPNRDGSLSEAELAASIPQLTSELFARIVVMAAGARCAPEQVAARRTEQDGVRVRARYRCAEGARSIRVIWNLLDELPHGHRHVARVIAGGVVNEQVRFGRDNTFDVPRSMAPGARRSSAFEWFELGIVHILGGYDHLVFVFALVLVARSWLALVKVVSCFTLAHSLTLGLASLGVVTPPELVVEPAIALSIAYVGVENLRLSGRPRARPLVVFAFGLVHGFGFAGALSALETPRAELPFALVFFNLGVEAGQIAVIAALFPVIARLRARRWFMSRLVPVGSAAVVLLGLGWFVERVWGAL